ncbi:hypothetical protein TSH58p_17410 [Azospirillum sp. TSH58]|uniref:PD-(D/E)XK nuclease family protein n=1 Tax=Azospirillum sp. TSH58 TaxID=664962 RepID=UPI000D600893|nr:PD-(D/E)XK nuclease family protein [Azospirillum sp. TSH58]AWJ85143.1 hypothetical protein TSH58p_17410 [Azospirillum sp. TSH58]PWC80818.1 hypothetical protein TSH58_00815 [Azospirillum sp. TSH58]
MSAPFEPTIVRSSSLSGYPDCPRRSAAKLFRREVLAAGYRLRELPNGIGAAVGTAVHAGAAVILQEKAKTGGLPPISTATDAAIDSLRTTAAKGIGYDRETPALNEAEQQAERMVRVYRAQIAPDIQPLIVEERLEAQVTADIILSGQSDVIAREPGRVRDLKTGKARSNHKPQLGSYSLLARSNGIDVTEACEDFIQRAPLKKPQPDAQIIKHDLAAAETAAIAVLRHIEDDLKSFRLGNPSVGVLPGDAWAFPANPNSKLCSAKWCPAHGTSFCREHMSEE